MSQNLIDEIKKQQNAKNWQKVIELSAQFSQQEPEKWEGLWWQGQAYKDLRQYDKAQLCFQQLQEKFPNNHIGWEGMVTIPEHQKNWDEMAKRVATFEAKFPDLWHVAWWRGFLAKQNNQLDEAEKHFAKLVELRPTWHRGLEELIHIAQNKKQENQVIELSQQLQAACPNMWQGYWLEGHAHKRLGDYEHAQQCFQQLQEKFPNNHIGWEGMVNISEHQQNWDEMAQHVAAFEAKFPDLWHVAWWRGFLAKQNNQLDEAEKHFAKLAQLRPTWHKGLEEIIKIKQEKQQFNQVIELSQQFQAAFPKMWQGYWWAGHAYKNMLQYRHANAEFDTLIEKFPKQHQGYEGKINVLEHQNDWQAVLHEAESFRQRFPNMWHSLYWQAHAHRHLAEYAAAIHAFNEMMTQFPDNHRAINGLIDVANDKNDWAMALEFVELAIMLFPQHLPFYQQKGQILLNLKQFAQAEQYFIELAQKFPNDPMSLLGYAKMCAMRNQNRMAVDILAQSLEKFPNNQNVVRDLIQMYLTFNEAQRAQEVYDKHLINKDLPENQLLFAQIQKAILGHSEYIAVLEDIFYANPHNFHIANQYAQALADGNMPELALNIWENGHLKYPKNNFLFNNLIYAYIKFGKHEQAQNMIAALPAFKQNAGSLKMKAWAENQKNNFTQARHYWSDILKKEFRLEMQLEKGETELKLLSQKAIEIKEKDIVLLAVQRDELLRLPDFLNHYRKLGVNQFIFVDNGSTDGSLQLLLQQDDCHVFATEHSYRESGSGVAWINHLVHKYIKENQWFIHADVDELLIYPHCETQTLPKLTEYLDSQNAEAMSSFMLDMYPADLKTQLSFQAGEKMVEKAPYFYNQYRFDAQMMCPYVRPIGGIFQHFDISTYLTKTALVKMRPDFYFVCSTHYTTPMKMADISATYLHFKMLGDFKNKAIAETQRKEHWSGGANYAHYTQIYEKHISETTDLSALDKSVKYQNSTQLVDLGLIQTSDSWEAFVRKSQEK